MSFVFSAIIIIGAIVAVAVEKYKKRPYYFNSTQQFFAASSIISAIAAAAMTIIAEYNLININWWQGIIIAIVSITAIIIVVRMQVIHASTDELKTYFPETSTDINLVIFVLSAIYASIK